MNVNDFYHYLEQPDELNDISVRDLKEVLERYPYFQAAHLLYLKNLHRINDDTYSSQLTVASLYAPNRNVLYHLIHSTGTETQIQNEPVIHFHQEEIHNDIVDEKPSEEISSIEEKSEIIPESTPTVDTIKTVIIQKNLLQEKEEFTVLQETPAMQKVDNTVNIEPVDEISIDTSNHNDELKIETPIPPASSKEIYTEPAINPTPNEEKTSIQEEPKKENVSIADQILEKLKLLQQSRNTNIPPSKPIETIPVSDEKKDNIPVKKPVIEIKSEKNKPVLAEIIEPEIKTDKTASLPKETEDCMTFEEWLYYLSSPHQEKNIEPEKNKIQNDHSIIDNFLKSNVDIRIKGNQTETQQDLTENMTSPEDFEIVSESLAQLYYQQGYLEKSLRMYEKLILKYPEKSIYFAPVIQELKNKLY